MTPNNQRSGWNCQNCGQKTFKSHYADEMDGLSHWDCPEPFVVDMGAVGQKIVRLERDLEISRWLIRRLLSPGGVRDYGEEARRMIGFPHETGVLDMNQMDQKTAIEQAEDQRMRFEFLVSKAEVDR